MKPVTIEVHEGGRPDRISQHPSFVGKELTTLSNCELGYSLIEERVSSIEP